MSLNCPAVLQPLSAIDSKPDYDQPTQAVVASLIFHISAVQKNPEFGGSQIDCSFFKARLAAGMPNHFMKTTDSYLACSGSAPSELFAPGYLYIYIYIYIQYICNSSLAAFYNVTDMFTLYLALSTKLLLALRSSEILAAMAMLACTHRRKDISCTWILTQILTCSITWHLYLLYSCFMRPSLHQRLKWRYFLIPN